MPNWILVPGILVLSVIGEVLPKENYVERAGDYIYLAGVYTR